MSTVRRSYAYLLAFAGLAMISFATAHLAQLLIDVVLQAPASKTDSYVRDTVSLYAAAALVGLPVWLVHWLWTARWVRSDPQERTSTLRRLYVYAVLAGATLEMAGSASDVLSSAFAALLGTSGTSVDLTARPLPFALIALGVWIAHWRIADRDRSLVGEHGGSASLRRWYVYGAAFVGLLMLVHGAQGIVESLWQFAVHAGAPAGAGMAPPAAAALVGLGLWVVHWRVLPKQADDVSSTLHSVYLFFGLAVVVIGTLLGSSQLLFYAVGRLLGVDHPGGVGGDLLQAAAGPASIGIVYGAAWAYQRQTLRHQSALFATAPRPAGVRRLYRYLVALVALGVLASGVAGLLWTLGDIAFPAPAIPNSDAWREQVALFATLIMVGLPVWLLHWIPRPGPVDETRSLARRLYLYLALIVAMLALVSSAAAGMYRLLGLALGASFKVDVAADLAHALAVACVAAILAVYHWRVIRADVARIQPLVRPDGPARAVVEIHAADAAALSRAMSTLRSTGVTVTIMQPAIPEDG